MHAATRKHRAGVLSALFVIALSCGVPFLTYQYIRSTLLLDRYRLEMSENPDQTLQIIDEMNSCRFLIDPMLERKLKDAQKTNNKKWVVHYSAALLPTHPDKLDYLYSVLLPEKKSNPYDPIHATYLPSYENALAEKTLSVHDPAFAARMWEVAADNRQLIWKRYFAASRLANIDPLNNKWEEIAPDIVAHHDFANDPFLAFSADGLDNKLDTHIKEVFKKPLLKKIEQCNESNCPAGSCYGMS